MKISIVANGFQEDYTLNLINALAGQDVRVDFIGSNIYDRSLIDKRINFYNVRKEVYNKTNGEQIPWSISSVKKFEFKKSVE